MKIKKSVTLLQTYSRGLLARRKYWQMKCRRAAITIQTNWRRFYAKKQYEKIRTSVIGIQKFARGHLARKRFEDIRKHKAATTIQRYARGYLARTAYLKTIKQIVMIQGLVRQRIARKILKQLKVEAKSVQHVTQLNRGLERKIIELQMIVNSLNAELAKKKTQEASLSKEKEESHKLDLELKNLKNIISDKEKDLGKLQADLESKDKSYAGIEKQLSESYKVVEKLKEMNKSMENSFDSKAVEAAVAEKETTLVINFEREKKILLEERESEKYAHQQLLRKYAALEDKMQGEQDGYIAGDRSPG